MRGALGGTSSAPSLLTLDPALNHALRMAAAGEAVAAACGLVPTVRGGGGYWAQTPAAPPPNPRVPARHRLRAAAQHSGQGASRYGPNTEKVSSHFCAS